jgi:1-acyl-sn-glycerol-3-phosphate acyltransferase
MRTRLDRWWRMLATGFCFAVFGSGGVLMTLGGVPLIWFFLFFSRALRVSFARQMIHYFFRFFVWLMQFTGGISVEIRGGDKLKRSGLLVLANHPSLIDVVILISLIPKSNCVIKAALGKNPVTRWPVKAAEYIFNEDGVLLVEECQSSFEKGSTILIFPEGTRTRRGQPIALKRGAANVAVRCKKAVTPVVITCRPPMLGKEEPWYQVPPQRGHFCITVHDDISLESFYEQGLSEPLAVRKFTAALQSFFEQESHRATV